LNCADGHALAVVFMRGRTYRLRRTLRQTVDWAMYFAENPQDTLYRESAQKTPHEIRCREGNDADNDSDHKQRPPPEDIQQEGCVLDADVYKNLLPLENDRSSSSSAVASSSSCDTAFERPASRPKIAWSAALGSAQELDLRHARIARFPANLQRSG